VKGRKKRKTRRGQAREAYSAAHDDAGKNRRRPQNPLLGSEIPVHPSATRSNRPTSRGEEEPAAAAPGWEAPKRQHLRLPEPCVPNPLVIIQS